MKKWIVGISVAVVLLSWSGGFGAGWLASAAHPGPPGPQGQAGSPGLPGPRGPATSPLNPTTQALCVRVDSYSDYNAIPPKNYVSNVQLWTPTGGRCLGGALVPVG